MLAAAVQVDDVPVFPSQSCEATINAIILDDSEFDRAKLRRLFKGIDMPIVIHEADDVAALEGVLNQDVFDVALIDHNLADRDGFDALKVLKQCGRHRSTACIMITGNDQSQVAVQALKQGCSDYITKQELSPERLKSSIMTALTEVAEASRASGDLTAEIDALTATIMAKYSNALQPEIAGILRQIRTLRSAVASSGLEATDLLNAVERRCTHLWQVLRNPEQLGIRP